MKYVTLTFFCWVREKSLNTFILQLIQSFYSFSHDVRYIEVFKSDNDEAMRAREKTMNAVTGGNRGGRGGFGGGFGGGYGGGFGPGLVRHIIGL